MATSVQERPPLEAELGARRTAEQAARRRRLHWFDLATSLWSPITVLALALIPYLVLIESFPSTAPAALPVMQGFGLLMVAWFVGLVAWRSVDRERTTLRRLRHDARELTGELSAGLSSVHDAAMRERLVDNAARVDAAAAAGDAATLDREIHALTDQATRLIPGFRKQNAIGVGIGIAKALAVALLIRAILIEPFRIPSGSMLPTLQIGDQIFVNKFIYGVHIPWANVVPFVIVRPPARGDVIVFENPITGQDYIKRVVGIPGDVIELKDDGVYLNGHVVPAQLVQRHVEVWDKPEESPWRLQHPDLWKETLGGREHDILLDEELRREPPPRDPIRVPPRSVFVMGDNRDNSLDSRFGLGGPRKVVFVPYGNIKGKAMIIWLSLSHGGLFSDLFGGTGLRAERFFRQVR
ncbi:MAG TPA: signal peptidase I [Myxococcaceae bacterium]|nr:signal peptidase I [Myxococcaceae bacterium]